MTTTKQTLIKARGLVGNVALVLKNHPELEQEYLDPKSKYYNCKNAIRWRQAIEAAE